MNQIPCRCGKSTKNFKYLKPEDMKGGYDGECCEQSEIDAKTDAVIQENQELMADLEAQEEADKTPEAPKGKGRSRKPEAAKAE